MVQIVEPPIQKVPFFPMKDYVLLEELEIGETPGGIQLPDDCDIDLPTGRVIAVGPGRRCEFDPSKIWPMDCQPGDLVYYGGNNSASPAVMIDLGDGKRYVRVRDRDITAWKRKVGRKG